MSSLLRLSLNEVDFAIKTEPQGNIAGIYNILAFKHTLHQVEGDGITRVVVDQNSYITPRSRGQAGKAERGGDQKRKEGLKSAPAQKNPRGTPTTPGRHYHSAQKSPSPKTTPASDEKSIKKKVVPRILLSKYEKSSSSKPKQLTDFVAIKKPCSSADEYRRTVKTPTQIVERPVASRGSRHPIENVLNLDFPMTPVSPDASKIHTPRQSSMLATPTIREKRSASNQADGNRSVDSKNTALKLSDRLTPK